MYDNPYGTVSRRAVLAKIMLEFQQKEIFPYAPIVNVSHNHHRAWKIVSHSKKLLKTVSANYHINMR